jgi:hypothetical protein
LKKLAGSVQFRFYKPETEKTELNLNKKNWKKLSQPEKTEQKLSQTGKTDPKSKKQCQTGFYSKKPNRTETGRFEPVSVSFLFFKKLV